MMADVEWDARKNASNLAKHGIGFDEARQIFDGPVLTRRDRRIDHGEIRDISIGAISGIVIVVVVHTRRDEAVRIISARLANRAERTRCHEHLDQTPG